MYVSLYLFTYSVLQTLVTFCFPGLIILVYLLLTALYGAALASRLREGGIFVDRFGWRRLFQTPFLFTTLAVLIPLACMYMPMLHVYHPWKVWTGPMAIYLPGSTYMNAGHIVDWGSVVVGRGIEVAYSPLAYLLLGAMGVTYLLRLEGVVSAAGSVRFMRVAAVLVGLWWLLFGKGYRSLDNIFNWTFLAGYALLLLLLFAPGRLNPTLAGVDGQNAS